MHRDATLSVYIGFDRRERLAYDVCRFSLVRHSSIPLHIVPLNLPALQQHGLYRRPTESRPEGMWDVISDAPMSTEFAITRFMVPHLARTGPAVFMDCDMLVKADIAELLDLFDPTKALQCVKHKHEPAETVKMDGQVQTSYARKNWSSFVLWNCDDHAHKRFTIDQLNSYPGRDLHRFFWVPDYAIGDLPEAWNWLEGTSDERIEPKVIHYTRGGPWFPEYRHVAYANQWQDELQLMREAA